MKSKIKKIWIFFIYKIKYIIQIILNIILFLNIVLFSFFLYIINFFLDWLGKYSFIKLIRFPKQWILKLFYKIALKINSILIFWSILFCNFSYIFYPFDSPEKVNLVPGELHLILSLLKKKWHEKLIENYWFFYKLYSYSFRLYGSITFKEEKEVASYLTEHYIWWEQLFFLSIVLFFLMYLIFFFFYKILLYGFYYINYREELSSFINHLIKNKWSNQKYRSILKQKWYITNHEFEGLEGKLRLFGLEIEDNISIWKFTKEEIKRIIMRHIDRFVDENGNIVEGVEKIREILIKIIKEIYVISENVTVLKYFINKEIFVIPFWNNIKEIPNFFNNNIIFYQKIEFFLFIGILICIFFIYLTYLIHIKKKPLILNTVIPYECGYEIFHNYLKNNQIYVRWYIVSNLFLIFELEIFIMLPIFLTWFNLTFIHYFFFNIFFIILIIGYIYELFNKSFNFS